MVKDNGVMGATGATVFTIVVFGNAVEVVGLVKDNMDNCSQ